MTTAPATSVSLAKRWNTLKILKAGRAVLLGLDGVLLLAVLVGAGQHRAAMQVVGKDTAPSIVAAQRIKSALADMDANAANQLLEPPFTTSPSIAAYDRQRIEASKELIEAAKNITYGDAEQVPIETVQDAMGTYEQLIQEALDLQDAGQAEVLVRYYRHASAIMDFTVLPATDALDRANDAVLERTYREESRRSLLTSMLVLAAGLSTLALLVGSQLFLARRTHRLLNPLLAVATVATLWITFYAFAGLSDEEHRLKVAKEDAFTSIRILLRARAIAYSANGDESRYLLDRDNAADYERDFFEKARLLANPTDSAKIRDAIADAARGHTIPGFTGYLADELNNITFPGERDAAIETLANFERYLEVDREVRQLERDGKDQEAIFLCIGASEGQRAFEQFDQALLATLNINQRAFDGAVDEGFSALSGMEYKAAGATGLIAILVFLGIAPRIREYE